MSGRATIAKGGFIQEITKVYQIFIEDDKKRIRIDGCHVGNFSIPLPPDWPMDVELRKNWPATTKGQSEEYYKLLLTGKQNVPLGN